MNTVSMGVIEQSQGETGDKSEKDLISLGKSVMTAGWAFCININILGIFVIRL